MTSPSSIVWRGLAAIAITVVCASALCSPAAATIVYSTGFESGEGVDYFIVGNVAGQGGWSDGPADARAVVQAGTFQSGAQALQIDRTEEYWFGGDDPAIAAKCDLSDPTAANPLVTISLSLRITADNEACYGIATYDGSTCTNSVVFELYDPFLHPADIIVNGVSTGQSWSADVNTWVALEILLDFTYNLADVSYKGASIADDVPFLNNGNLTSFAILTDDGWYDGGSSMFVDNLSVTAVPEPGTFVLLLGLCAATVLRRRRH